MELEAVNKVGPGSHATAAAGLEGFVRSVVESLLAQAVQAAGESVVLFLLAMGSLSDDGGVMGEKDDVDERYIIHLVRRSKNQVTPENKDDGDSGGDDDEDEDEDEDEDVVHFLVITDKQIEGILFFFFGCVYDILFPPWVCLAISIRWGKTSVFLFGGHNHV
uniref:Uncharacterized protein n=1 Tax=Anthurium amnicola TaxID=1678845 RepID=A0A1D1YFQ1_9ARAE